MMEFFQSIVRSIFGKIILGILCVGMAMWGFGDTLGTSLDSSLAKSGGYSFSVSDLDNVVEQQQRAMSQNGNYVSKADLVENGMVDQIFNIFSDQTATLGYGQKFGVMATEDKIWEDIKSDSRFHDVSGQFSLPVYRDYVNRGLNMSVTDFEERIKDDQTLLYMSGVLSGFDANTSGFDAIEFAYSNEARHISWMRLPLDAALEQAPIPTEDDLRAYYSANSAQYFREETREIDVLHVSTKDFLHRVNADDDALRAFYEAIKATQFALPTPRSFDEILFETQAQAQASIGVLGAGGGASDLDGFVGVNSRTVLQADIDDPALAQVFSPYTQTSQLLGVRQVDDNWAVTRVTDIPPTSTRPFDEVKDRVRDLYREQQSLSLLFNALEPLNIAIASGETLPDLATELGVPIISLSMSASDGRDAQGVENTLLTLNAEALEQVFILDQGDYTDMFDVGEIDTSAGGKPRGAVLLEVRKINAGHLPEFDAIVDQITQDYIADAREKSIEDFKTGLQADLVTGAKGFQETADEFAVTIQNTGANGLTRIEIGAFGLPPAAQGAIFEGSQGDISVYTEDDAILFLKIDEIMPAQPDLLGIQLQPNMAMLGASLERDLQEAFLIDAKTASHLKLDYEYLNAYKRRSASAG